MKQQQNIFKIHTVINIITIMILISVTLSSSLKIYAADSTKKDSVKDERASTQGTEKDNDKQKKFYTITATDGVTYYLVIDEESATNNVYFLKEVNSSDLASLTEETLETDNSYDSSGSPLDSIESQVKEKTVVKEKNIDEELPPDVTVQPDSSPIKPETQKKTKSKLDLSTILIGVGLVGGAGYYFLFKRKRDKQHMDTSQKESEYSEDDDFLEFDSPKPKDKKEDFECVEVDDDIEL